MGPIDAGAGEHATGSQEFVGVEVECRETLVAVVGEDVVSRSVGAQRVVGEQPVAKLDADATGEMVVAGSRFDDRLLRAVLAQRADRDGRGDPRERLQCGGDLGPGELVVAMSALDVHAHEAAVDEATQMGCSRRGSDPRVTSELARRQRPTVREHREHRRPDGMADQRADRRQVPIASNHVLSPAIHPACHEDDSRRNKAFWPYRPAYNETERSTGMADQPITTSSSVDPAIERVFTAWDDALGAKDLDAAMALYHPDATLESPLVSYLLGVEEGVVRGREALRSFVEQVFDNQPAERRRFRTGFLTDGQHLTWEYPRQTPEGDQMDFVKVMEITDGLIAHHRVYWGWKGVGMLLRDEHGR